MNTFNVGAENRKQLYLVLLLFVIVGVGFGAHWLYRSIVVRDAPEEQLAYWEEEWSLMESDCRGRGLQSSLCYQETIPRLIKEQRADSIEGLVKFCNTFGSRPHNGCFHALGFAFAELSGDNAEEALLLCDKNLSEFDVVHCHNSVLAHVLSQEGIVATNRLLDACRRVVADDFCMIAIGSAFTLLEEYNLNNAVAHCNETVAERHKTNEKSEEYCWGGVFIENYHAGPIVRGDPWFPCNTIASKYLESCVYLHPRIMRQEHGFSDSRIVQECQNAPGGLIKLCNDGLAFLTDVHDEAHVQGHAHKCSVRELIRTGESDVESWLEERRL